jgi:acetoin utilization protein AcuB
MSLPKHTVQDFYTQSPYTVDGDDNVDRAQELMTSKGIRHLPVTSDGKLVGVLSDRDIKTALTFKGASSKRLRCADLCTEHVYVTHRDSPLAAVAGELASKHYGSAVVTEKDEVVGIFTTTDACRALSEVLTNG